MYNYLMCGRNNNYVVVLCTHTPRYRTHIHTVVPEAFLEVKTEVCVWLLFILKHAGKIRSPTTIPLCLLEISCVCNL